MRMRPTAKWLACGLMSMVAAAAAPRWKYMCYDGFVESVDVLVGPGATDCGVIDRRNDKVVEGRVREAADCVSTALTGRQPFKFGTIPPDSNVVYVLLRSAAGELWQIRYERSLGKRDIVETQVNQKCRDMTFDVGALIFQGVDCALVSNDRLPTHDTNPRH
jgi:hypothetical protein